MVESGNKEKVIRIAVRTEALGEDEEASCLVCKRNDRKFYEVYGAFPIGTEAPEGYEIINAVRRYIEGRLVEIFLEI